MKLVSWRDGPVSQSSEGVHALLRQTQPLLKWPQLARRRDALGRLPARLARATASGQPAGAEVCTAWDEQVGLLLLQERARERRQGLSRPGQARPHERREERRRGRTLEDKAGRLSLQNDELSAAVCAGGEISPEERSEIERERRAGCIAQRLTSPRSSRNAEEYDFYREHEQRAASAPPSRLYWSVLCVAISLRSCARGERERCECVRQGARELGRSDGQHSGSLHKNIDRLHARHTPSCRRRRPWALSPWLRARSYERLQACQV